MSNQLVSFMRNGERASHEVQGALKKLASEWKAPEPGSGPAKTAARQVAGLAMGSLSDVFGLEGDLYGLVANLIEGPTKPSAMPPVTVSAAFGTPWEAPVELVAVEPVVAAPQPEPVVAAPQPEPVVAPLQPEPVVASGLSPAEASAWQEQLLAAYATANDARFFVDHNTPVSPKDDLAALSQAREEMSRRIREDSRGLIDVLEGRRPGVGAEAGRALNLLQDFKQEVFAMDMEIDRAKQLAAAMR